MSGDAPAPAWMVILISALPPVGAAVWHVYDRWNTRKERGAAAEISANQTAAQRMQEDLIAQRAALTTDQAALFDRVNRENERLVVRNRELERDRDRGWQLGRLYYQMACDLSHALNNARAIAGALAARVVPAQTLPEWQVFDVPLDMEDQKQ